VEENSFVDFFEEAGAEGVGYFEGGGEDFLDQVVRFVWIGVHVLLVGFLGLFLRELGIWFVTGTGRWYADLRGWTPMNTDGGTTFLVTDFGSLFWPD
jgi:hypothetical protein